MTEQFSKRPEALVQLSRHEMQEVTGGATVDYFLKLKGVDGEATSYTGTANGGVWKTTNFLTRD